MTLNSNIKVEKIGGTSMTRFAEVLDSTILRDSSNIKGRILIMSAYGGVTNKLLEHKKSGEPGVYGAFISGGDYERKLRDLGKFLLEINASLVPIGLNEQKAKDFVESRIEDALEFLNLVRQVLASGYVERSRLILAARELLASIGESHSVFNSVNILEQRDIPVKRIDLSGWNDARQFTISERIEDSFKGLNVEDMLCCVTGYVKGVEGIMREFDRGYSEVTFSRIAVMLKASEAIIHKEYHLSSGDPKVIGVDKVIPVCATNYDVGDQLADIGMEAIHPKASKPLEKSGILLRVTNAFDPEHSGTTISKDYVSKEPRVEIISGSDSLTVIEIHDTNMVGEVGFDLKIMKVFGEYNVSYVSKSTNANTISIVVHDKDVTDNLLKSLKDIAEYVKTIEAAIVCAIGSNMCIPGLLSESANALSKAKINIISMCQSSRQTNMQFVIERGQFDLAQQALHEALI